MVRKRLTAEEEALLIEEAKNKEEWDRFEASYLSSPQAVAASKAATCSADRTKQWEFLAVAETTKRSLKPKRVDTTDMVIRRELLSLVRLQNTKGYWEASEEVWELIGNRIPAAPYGIVGFRWATALAMAFIRRYPEHCDLTDRAHQRGLEWVQPLWLLEAAKKALPPRDVVVHLDDAAVKDGTWREAMGQTLALEGYEAFRPESGGGQARVTTSPATARSTTPKFASFGTGGGPSEELLVLSRPASTHLGSNRPLRGKLLSDRTAHLRYSSHQKNLRREFRELTRASGRTPQTELPLEEPRPTLHSTRYTDSIEGGPGLEGAGHAERSTDRLRAVWLQPTSIAQERGRLAQVQRKLVHREEWNARFGQRAVLDVAEVHEPDGSQVPSGSDLDGCTAPQHHPNKTTGPLAVGESTPMDTLEFCTMKQSGKVGLSFATRRGVARVAPACSTSTGLSGASPRGARSAVSVASVQAAEDKVVHAMVEYDRYIVQIKETMRRNAATYASVRLVSQRQRAFEELTAMLGPYCPARRGFPDWRGREVKGLQSIICRAIDAIQAWRTEKYNADHPVQADNSWLASTGLLDKHSSRRSRPTTPATEGTAGPVEPNVQGPQAEHDQLGGGNGEQIHSAPPFRWNGVNAIVAILHGLDFLSECQELVHWYDALFLR